MQVVVAGPDPAGCAGQEEHGEAEQELETHQAQREEAQPGVEAEHVRDGRLGEVVGLPDSPDSRDTEAHSHHHQDAVQSLAAPPTGNKSHCEPLAIISHLETHGVTLYMVEPRPMQARTAVMSSGCQENCLSGSELQLKPPS